MHQSINQSIDRSTAHCKKKKRIFAIFNQQFVHKIIIVIEIERLYSISHIKSHRDLMEQKERINVNIF